MDATAKVKKEMVSFRAMLPDLIRKYKGKWVVVNDGELVDVFDDEADAHEFAVARFGSRGGFVIAQAVKETPVPINIAILFGAVP